MTAPSECHPIILIRTHPLDGGEINPDSKIHGANMGPTWVLSAPDGPHVGPMNLAIREYISYLLWHLSVMVNDLIIVKLLAKEFGLTAWGMLYWVYIINPLRAKFFRGNINMYLHFMSFLHIDLTQVLKILPQVRPTHSILSMSWLLMSWRRKEPGHQQPWYWPS